jgi:hypothetical protein
VFLFSDFSFNSCTQKDRKSFDGNKRVDKGSSAKGVGDWDWEQVVFVHNCVGRSTLNILHYLG